MRRTLHAVRNAMVVGVVVVIGAAAAAYAASGGGSKISARRPGSGSFCSVYSRSDIGLSLDELVHSLNPIRRGWTNYRRHAASKRCFSYLDHYLLWRVMLWLRKKHPRITWKQIGRRY